jgi:hypothetical protein
VSEMQLHCGAELSMNWRRQRRALPPLSRKTNGVFVGGSMQHFPQPDFGHRAPRKTRPD